MKLTTIARWYSELDNCEKVLYYNDKTNEIIESKVLGDDSEATATCKCHYVHPHVLS